MYYLAKFCRICIQTDVALFDLDSVDIDQIRLSEKLEVCAKMLVGRESLSTEICIQCIIKLRISYQFQSMCKKSTKVLQGYLTELIGPRKVDPDSFVNSELTVSISPLPTYNNNNDSSSNSSDPISRKKRITKGQRCSLLKKLLSRSDENNRPYDEGGGLRNIINFTKNYDFTVENNNKPTPLDKLTEFSKDFFRHDFSQYRNTILYIIENKDVSDSDDELFDSCDEDAEELVVEPDIQIKKEEEYDEEMAEPHKDCTVQSIKQEPECPLIASPEYKNNNNAMQLLDRLVENYAMGRTRTFSPASVRCRTRNNPYISPSLKQQFLYQNFRCQRCDRYFKSIGYLKAHETKVHMHHKA